LVDFLYRSAPNRVRRNSFFLQDTFLCPLFFPPFTPFWSFLLFGLTELNCINYYFQRLFLLSPDIDKAVDILRHSFYDFLPLIFGQMFNIFSVVVWVERAVGLHSSPFGLKATVSIGNNCWAFLFFSRHCPALFASEDLQTGDQHGSSLFCVGRALGFFFVPGSGEQWIQLSNWNKYLSKSDA